MSYLRPTPYYSYTTRMWCTDGLDPLRDDDGEIRWFITADEARAATAEEREP